MAVNSSGPDPSQILMTGFAFMQSKVLLTAVGMDLFTVLGDETMTGPELGKKLGLHERGIYDFFDSLLALGMLEREGDGPEAKYSNTEEAKVFLVKTSPEYIGGMLEMLNARLFPAWGNLEEALRTGKHQNKARDDGEGVFDALYADEVRLEQFLNAMSGVSRGNFRAFADIFDFSKAQTLCDAGGASGLLSILVAQQHPHMKCISFDLPPVAPVAQRNIEKAGVSDRVEAVGGDFFKDPIPSAQIITMGMILHDWNLEQKKVLIKKVYDALPEGGAFVAIEHIIDDARRDNLFGMIMSLNMLIEIGDAFDYTGAQFESWCKEVGFDRVEIVHLNGPCSAAVAYK